MASNKNRGSCPHPKKGIYKVYTKDLTGYYFVKGCFTKTRGGPLGEAEREVKQEKSRTVRTRTMNENSMMVA